MPFRNSPCAFFPFLVLLIASHAFSQTQHEYAVSFNPQNVTYNRLQIFPNVATVNSCTAYDQNHKLLFFQGSPTWTLFTVDVVTGNIVHQVNNFTPMNPQVGMMFYDNTVDTLYGLYFDGTFNQMYCAWSWIDPASGAIHVKDTLPYISAPLWWEGTYDEIDHRFMFVGYDTVNAHHLYTVDAFTGNVLSSPPENYTVSDLAFDNANGRLYAVVDSATWQNSRFDSIEPATGIHHPLLALNNCYVYSRRTVAIDESSGNYIFVARTYPQADSIYTIDLQTNTLIDQKLYPFDPSGQVSTAENILGYNFDESLNTIFAIQWGHDSSIVEGENAVQQESRFALYPNPAAAKTVIYPGRPYRDASVIIRNTLGEIVLSANYADNMPVEIETAGFAPGIYFVSLVCDGENCGTQKLLVNR